MLGEVVLVLSFIFGGAVIGAAAGKVAHQLWAPRPHPPLQHLVKNELLY